MFVSSARWAVIAWGWMAVVGVTMARLATAEERGAGAPDWAKVSKEQLAYASKSGLPVATELDLGNGVKIRAVLIPPGEFTMGSQDGNPDERPTHRARVTKPFYMAIHEVTQAQYDAVIGKNPSKFKGNDGPVEQVCWNDAAEFCQKLRQRSGVQVELPTEAQWEYACRAGSATKFSFGDSENDLGQYGWYGRNSQDTTHPVGGKLPNLWGLYDLHGNVWEWCQDWYGSRYYRKSEEENPQGPPTGSYRVVRGGSALSHASNCRAAYRSGMDPSYRNHDYGFRVALPAKTP